MSRLIRQAGTRVSGVIPYQGFSPTRIIDVLAEMKAAQDRGAIVRIALLPASLFTTGIIDCLRGSDLSLDIRVLSERIDQFISIDGEHALFHDVHDGTRHQDLICESAAAVKVLDSVFDVAWTSGKPVNEYTGLGGSEARGHRNAVLQSLSAGMTDETASRTLGISVRTYRRHVSSILQAMDCDSRFQAGVKVAHLGLIPGPLPHSGLGRTPN